MANWTLATGGRLNTSGGFVVVKITSHIDGDTSEAVIDSSTVTIVPILHGHVSIHLPPNIAADHAEWLLTVL